MMKTVTCVLVLVTGSIAIPISQSVYPSAQLVNTQQQPAPAQPQTYRQQPFFQTFGTQPQYLAGQAQQQTSPIFDSARRAQLPQYAQQPIQQVLLPTAVDRQVQRVANQVAGPQYAQQVQFVQQQAQAQQALAAAQRKATSQTFSNRPIQPLPVPQPQYLRELPQPQPQPRPYARPAPENYRPAVGVQQQQQPALPEEYDSNPSYQFGFDVKDDLYTNYQNRNEQREGDKISGSYSVVDSDGFIRTVKYTADAKEGFKAEVTRQPTDIVVKIPKPLPPQEYVQAQPARSQGQKENLIYRYQ